MTTNYKKKIKSSKLKPLLIYFEYVDIRRDQIKKHEERFGEHLYEVYNPSRNKISPLET